MNGLNSILARIYSPSILTGSGAAGAGEALPQSRQEGAGGDVFQAGQYWKNRGGAVNDPMLANGCRCGNCPRCAAQAYAGQSQQLEAGKSSDPRENSAGEKIAASGRDLAAEDGQVDEAQETGENLDPARPKGRDGKPLAPEEVAQLMELKKADAAVRAHEQAHLAAAGGLAKGGANFSYQRGPDGRNYAVAGEVSIDTSKGATPAETISRMERVRAAALAPADPSPQDRKVAQSASVTMSEAREELRLENMGKAAQEKSEASSGAEDDSAAGEGDAGEKGPVQAPSDIARKAFSRYLSQPQQANGAIHLTA